MKLILDKIEAVLERRCKHGMCISSFSSLDKVDQTLFCAIVRSYGKTKYSQMESYCKASKSAYLYLPGVFDYISRPRVSKRYKVQYFEYKVNEPVSTLMRYYKDPNSGKVTYARTDLKKRFMALSRKAQVTIIKSFLESKNSSDREWAARQADLMWDKSFEKSLMIAFEARPSKSVSITAFRHLPIEYVREVKVVNRDAEAEFYKRLSQEGILVPSIDDLNIFEYLVAVSYANDKVKLAEELIEKKVFAYLYWYIHYQNIYEIYPRSFVYIPLFINAIDALGTLGLTTVLFKLLDLMDYIYPQDEYIHIDEQCLRAKKWIEDIWPMEGKEFFLDNRDLPSEEFPDPGMYWEINPSGSYHADFAKSPFHRHDHWVPYFDATEELSYKWKDHWEFLSEEYPRLYDLLVNNNVSLRKTGNIIKGTLYVKTELQYEWFTMRMHRFIVNSFKYDALGTKDEFMLNVWLEDDDLPMGDEAFEAELPERRLSVEKSNQFPLSIGEIYNDFF